MSTPDGGAVAPYRSDDQDVIAPTAISGPKPAAIHGLGEVLQTLIHRTNAFHSENEQDAASQAVRDFVDAHVSDADRRSFDPGDVRAAKEDVSLRTPPGGAAPAVVAGPVLDYAKLAQAILTAQREQGQVTDGS